MCIKKKWIIQWLSASEIILGNRVPIEEEELIEYIIDGTDRMLRNQAWVDYLRTRASVVGQETHRNEERWGKISILAEMDRSNEGEKNEQKKRNCFNSDLSDHFNKDCPTKENNPKCFKCDERGHIALKRSYRYVDIFDRCVMEYAIRQINVRRNLQITEGALV